MRKKRVLLGSVLVVCLCIIAGLSYWMNENRLDEYQKEALAQLEAEQGNYDEHTIVLTDTTYAESEALAEKLNATLRITEDGHFATLTLSEEVTIQDVYVAKENREYLETMSPDYYAKITDIQEDATLAVSWPNYPVSDALYDRQTYLSYMNMQDSWNYGTGSNITVAIIDTGIDTDHVEFEGRISENSYNATQDKIVKDYDNDWSLIEDEQGHGTAVAGVIGASMDENGIVGIAPGVELLVIKAECDENGEFLRTSDLVFGIYYAIEQDADIVNMSFGSSGDVFSDAIRLAVDSDIICVAAAGNDGTSAQTYPASLDGVISVGALDADSYELAYYSNYGDNSDIVAPGTTYTTAIGGGYEQTKGTSLACPTVVGALALYLSRNAYTDFDQVQEVLYASCYDLGDLGNDWYYGYGALDVDALLNQEQGVVTFNMLTDELDDETQVFVRNHTLQDIPEPERTYAVFDGWYYDIDCTEELELYADAFTTDLTLYAKWVNEEDGVPYTYVELEDGTIEIRSYTGKRRYITVPEYIDGKVVSSIGADAFKGNTRLREVTLPAQLTKISDRAFLGCSNLTWVMILH